MNEKFHPNTVIQEESRKGLAAFEGLDKTLISTCYLGAQKDSSRMT